MGKKYPSFFGPQLGTTMLTLNFYQEEVEFPLAFYTAIFQDSFSQEIADFDTISEEFLATSEGLEYFRWEFEAIIDGKSVHHIFCFFESGDWKLIISYTRLRSLGAEYDALVDEAMQTVRFER